MCYFGTCCYMTKNWKDRRDVTGCRFLHSSSSYPLAPLFPSHALSPVSPQHIFLPTGDCSDLKSSPFFSSSSRAASIPFFACELKAVSPYRRGFMCGDLSITYPYLHQEAISDELLITGGIIITGLTVSTRLDHPCRSSWEECGECNMTVLTTCVPPDRPWGVLPGSFQRCQLQGLCQEPVRVLSVQRAGLLPVRLLCRPIADQHGQAECWAVAAALPVCVRCHLCVAELHTWNLH